MDKHSLRIWAKNKRKELDIDYLSSILVEKLTQTNEYKNSTNIMLYYPLKYEINLLSLLKDNTKNFYLPRIKGNELECCLYNVGNELCESCFHTLEPTCNACDKSNIDLVILPALACDKDKYRLGYGGGFYDRFLASNNNVKKIICIPSALVVKTVYPEQHDVKADYIITELSLI